MLSRSHRFHGLGSLRGVYRNGRTARGPLFAVRYQLNSRRDAYRAAVVVSRKVHKSAVARNRMRRRIYAIVSDMESLINEPYDIVITVYHDDVLETPPAQLRRQLKKQFKAAGILR